MTAKILDGATLAKKIRAEIKSRVESGGANLRPGLAVVIVGDNPASQIYVRHKVRACEEAGFFSQKIEFAADLSEESLLEKIRELNADRRIHGILVQLPLPPQMNSDRIVEAIAPEKDVDGFHSQNVGALSAGRDALYPCTPSGCIRLLDEARIKIEGADAAIIGRSNIVGKPMAMMLINRGATVTVCHSKTQNLSVVASRADILVAAVGRAEMVGGEMVKEGAAVIDVGINRLDDGRLVGDVNFAQAQEKAGFITPVPGGVGPMTIAMLLANTLKSAELLSPKN